MAKNGLIQSSDYDTWWSELNSVQTTLGITNTSKPTLSTTIKATEINSLINAVNSLQNNTFAAYADWTNHTESVKSAGSLAEYLDDIDATLGEIKYRICANYSQNSVTPRATTGYSVEAENISTSYGHFSTSNSFNSTNSDCSTNSTFTRSNHTLTASTSYNTFSQSCSTNNFSSGNNTFSQSSSDSIHWQGYTRFDGTCKTCTFSRGSYRCTTHNFSSSNATFSQGNSFSNSCSTNSVSSGNNTFSQTCATNTYQWTHLGDNQTNDCTTFSRSTSNGTYSFFNTSFSAQQTGFIVRTNTGFGNAPFSLSV